jgi:hypothetical protein
LVTETLLKVVPPGTNANISLSVTETTWAEAAPNCTCITDASDPNPLPVIEMVSFIGANALSRAVITGVWPWARSVTNARQQIIPTNNILLVFIALVYFQ